MPIVPDMVGIVVSDLSAAVRFYRLLGLAFADPKESDGYLDVTTSNGYRISLNTEAMMRSLDPTWEKPRGQRMEIAFKCESPKDVDETYEAIVRAGHAGHKTPWDAFWGQRYAIVSDPDGTHVCRFFAPISTSARLAGNCRPSDVERQAGRR